MNVTEIAGAMFRHALTTGAGYLVAKGHVDADTANQLIGTGVGLFGLVLSFYNKKKK